jgi:hypothetical protein
VFGISGRSPPNLTPAATSPQTHVAQPIIARGSPQNQQNRKHIGAWHLTLVDLDQRRRERQEGSQIQLAKGHSHELNRGDHMQIDCRRRSHSDQNRGDAARADLLMLSAERGPSHTTLVRNKLSSVTVRQLRASNGHAKIGHCDRYIGRPRNCRDQVPTANGAAGASTPIAMSPMPTVTRVR